MRSAEFQEAEAYFKVAYPNPPGTYYIGPYKGSSTLYSRYLAGLGIVRFAARGRS